MQMKMQITLKSFDVLSFAVFPSKARVSGPAADSNDTGLPTLSKVQLSPPDARQMPARSVTGQRIVDQRTAMKAGESTLTINKNISSDKTDRRSPFCSMK